MLSACGAKASTFTLQTRKRGIIFSGPPSPRLSSPPRSSVPGALLLLRDQETALNVLPSSSDTKQGAMALYASCLGRDMWCVYTRLGEQGLGYSRGTHIRQHTRMAQGVFSRKSPWATLLASSLLRRNTYRAFLSSDLL